MDKKIYIQISLIFLVIFIIIFIYIGYFSSSKTKITENDKGKTEVDTVQSTDDLIKEMLKKNTKTSILNEENFDEIETQLENNEE